MAGRGGGATEPATHGTTGGGQHGRPQPGPDRHAMVPQAQPQTYYDQPVIKPPVWTWEIPTYFFAGGLAGAASVMAVVADAAGDRRLARAARLTAGVAAATGPPLLIADLGRPQRFLNMLRVFRPTSPMSVGSWVLMVYAPAALGAAGLEATGRLPRLKVLAGAGAAVMGPPLATYTAVLVANTAVPVWHEARTQLPALFAASGMAAAGAAGVVTVPGSGAARAVAVSGAAAELAIQTVMEQRLGDLAAPYEEGTAGRLQTVASTCTAIGAGLLTVGAIRRRRAVDVAGAALLLAGALTQRWAVFMAGFASAKDPAATVVPQRNRVRARDLLA